MANKQRISKYRRIFVLLQLFFIRKDCLYNSCKHHDFAQLQQYSIALAIALALIKNLEYCFDKAVASIPDLHFEIVANLKIYVTITGLSFLYLQILTRLRNIRLWLIKTLLSSRSAISIDWAMRLILNRRLVAYLIFH